MPDVQTATPGSALQDHPPFAGYSDEPRPLAAHGLLIATFATLLGAGIAAGRRRRDGLPERIGAGDVVMAGIATHKLSRLVTKDKVTGVLRAPFTRYEGSAGPAEIEESPRGRGLRYAIGELLVCPYCFDQWLAGAFTCGLLAAPRPTRVMAAMLNMVALSDFLQIAYKKGASDAVG